MKVWQTLALLLGVGVAYSFISQRGASKSLKIYFDGLDIKPGSGFTLPDFIARFRLLNPSNTAITARNITGEILVNGKQFGIISSAEPINIPASSEMLAKIKLRIPVGSLVSSVIALIRKKQKLTVVFDGNINSNGFLLPINQKIFVQA